MSSDFPLFVSVKLEMDVVKTYRNTLLCAEVYCIMYSISAVVDFLLCYILSFHKNCKCN